jgi:hypothetical protein
MTNSAVKIPFSERFNLRMILFITVIGFLVGYPIYVLIDAQVSHGIKTVAGGYKEVNLKAMGNFVFDGQNGTVKDVPPQYRELDGQKVVLVGEMYAGGSYIEANRFQLVYSIAKCCFGGPPKVQERVFCIVPNDGTVPILDRPARVTGTLHVAAKKDGDTVNSLYTLDVHKVEPAS